MLHRTVGPFGAVDIAGAATWDTARVQLAPTIYGTNLPADADRPTARLIAATTTAWQLRVLAGWCPPTRSSLARLMAGPLEMITIERHLAWLAATSRVEATTTHVAAPPAIRLGPLGSVSHHLPSAKTPAELRKVLIHSSWGDPGGIDLPTVAFGLRVSWLRRVARRVSRSRQLAAAAVAVLVARERFAFGRTIAETTSRDVDGLIGSHWRTAESLEALVDRLPTAVALPLTAVSTAEELWTAEVAVLRGATAAATRLSATTTSTESTVAAIMALLLIDLWRVDAAIEIAGRGPIPAGVLDDLA